MLELRKSNIVVFSTGVLSRTYTRSNDGEVFRLNFNLFELMFGNTKMRFRTAIIWSFSRIP